MMRILLTRRFLTICLLVIVGIGASILFLSRIIQAQGTPFCGNSIINPPEQCDDNNFTNGDGCSDVCQNESPCDNDTACEPSSGENCVNCQLDCLSCVENCANGVDDADVDTLADCADTADCPAGTPCQDGGTCNASGICQPPVAPASTCDSFCRKTTCGDGVKQSPNGYGVNEDCEKDADCAGGALCDTSLCRCVSVNAVTGVCGNGIREGAEFCDDGKRCTDTGERCRVNADCGNGECKGFSGDGCTSPGG